MKSFNHFVEDCNKSLSKYLSEDVNISGNASVGTIVIGGSQEPKQVGEQFFADIVWDGQLHRLEMFNEEDFLHSREECRQCDRFDYTLSSAIRIPVILFHNRQVLSR